MQLKSPYLAIEFLIMSEVSTRFFTLKEPSEGFFRDRGSKFFAFAYPISSLAEGEEHLAALRKRFHDARHHCYAYRLGDQGEESFAADDREPSNSAGPPILAAIRSAELTQVLVVVVRYFGGTKLGVRGLIEAYRTAATEAIEAGEKVEIIARVTFQLAYAYGQTTDINRLLHPYELEVVEAVYTDSVMQTLAIRVEEFDALHNQLDAAGFSVKVIAP